MPTQRGYVQHYFSENQTISVCGTSTHAAIGAIVMDEPRKVAAAVCKLCNRIIPVRNPDDVTREELTRNNTE